MYFLMIQRKRTTTVVAVFFSSIAVHCYWCSVQPCSSIYWELYIHLLTFCYYYFNENSDGSIIIVLLLCVVLYCNSSSSQWLMYICTNSIFYLISTEKLDYLSRVSGHSCLVPIPMLICLNRNLFRYSERNLYMQ